MTEIADKTYKRGLLIFKLAVLILIIVGTPAYILIFNYDIIESFKNISDIEAFLLEHKGAGFLVFIGTQVIQIIVCILPGQPIQFAAGYVFGTFNALILSVIGAVIGETIAFVLAKVLGHDAIYMLFGKSKASYYLNKFDSKKGYFILFVLYLIPGFPKDTINYLAGLSPLKLLPFLIIATVGRLIPMTCSVLAGVFVKSQQWGWLAVVVFILCSITVICVINKSKLLKRADRIYDRLHNM